MKLLTKALLMQLPELYSMEKAKDPQVVIKYFTPDSSWTWYVIEGQPDPDDIRFFGLVKGQFEELGYFTLSELENIRGPLGLRVERDLHFTPCPLSKVKSR